MANINQSVFKDMEAKGKKMETEVKELCKAGKRDKAQDIAMKFGKQMTSMPEMQAMKKCGEMAQGMIKELPNNAKQFEIE